MRHFLKTLSVILLLLSTEHAVAQTGLVTLHPVTSNHQGTLYLKVISAQQKEQFPNIPARQAVFSAIYRDVTATQILSLPAGEYAIALFQDLNENGALDSNILGIPSEPYGFSNNARGKFGPAKFTQAAFSITENQKITLTINLQ